MRLIDADRVNWETCPVGGYAIKEWLAEQPTIEAEPVKHGRWVETEDGEWECTNCKDAVVICACGKDVTRHKAVCPNCGAKMDGGNDHD